jgi:putative tricarboxylic transport membrane protein
VRKVDIGVSIGLIFLSVAVFFKANTYRQQAIFVYGPNFFPQLLSALIFICAVILLVYAIRGKVLAETDHIDKRGFLRLIAAIGICIGYLLIMQLIGFAIATSIFLFSLMALLGQVGMVKRVANSVIVSLVVWAIFHYFLLIPIPSGMWNSLS